MIDSDRFIEKSGYVKRKVNGKLVYEHRMVWETHNGKIPKGMQIDHINHDRGDNRLENLRLVTCQQNHFNRSGVKGFSWHKKTGKWRSYIKINGVLKSIGYTDCMLEARAKYLRAKSIYHII
jgi:hypothetical protein